VKDRPIASTRGMLRLLSSLSLSLSLSLYVLY
jgi:hypothetical protein